MPTNRTNVSLKSQDTELVISLREIIEKKGERLSLAEIIRRSLEHSWNNIESFKRWNV